MKDKGNKLRHNILGYLFLLPWLAGFLVFTAYPFINTIYLSFFNVTQNVMGVQTEFVGAGNYDIAFFRNADYLPALIDFVLMEITYTPTIIVIALILALLLNRSIKFRAAFRALFFLPVIVMSGPVMQQLMTSGSTADVDIGNMTLYRIVSSYSRPLAGALEFLFANYSMVLWFTGIPIVLFINGLQKINTSVIEAATIDSATPWQILWKITIPILRPIILLSSIFIIVQLGLYSVNPVFDLISDAMANTTGGLGLASAYAWIYSVVVMVLIGIAFLLFKENKENVEREVRKREKKWGRF